MKRILLISAALGWVGYVAPFLLTTAASAGIRVEPTAPVVHILSVGISDYADAAAPRLRTPTWDAQLLVSAFESMDTRVSLRSAKTLINVTRHKILEEYNALISQTDSDDLAVFFFSGHATQDSAKSKIYLIPVDFRGPDDLALTGLDLQKDIIDATPYDKKVLIIIDGCSVGDGSLGPLMDKHPQLAILASSKADEFAFEPASLPSTPFVAAMVDVLQLSVEELYVQLYPRMVGTNIGFYSKQHPSLVGLRSHRLMLATASVAETPRSTDRLDLTGLTSVPEYDTVSLNGKFLEQQAQYQIANGKVSFLGSGLDLIHTGINLLTVGREQYYLWRVGQSLKAFTNPYKNSRAIIVAIDDYDRRKDPSKRPPTGFQGLTGMVENAKKLKASLISLGFPEKGIIELYDERATLKELEEALESFWTGGPNASTDRLFVYFGGHGEEFQRNNLLVTYDYDESRRLMTTFQAKDLVERHARSIEANHVLFAIDVCYSGLVFLGPDNLKSELQETTEIQRLAIVERDVSKRARNIITAGTGDQRALSENGGIFTKALIEGLQGSADPANSGVIQFDQLGIFVKDRVTQVARGSGYYQVPKYSSLNEYEGRMMFIRPAN